MFERIDQLAQRTATRASRRQFLGHVGRGAMALAAVVGAMLVSPDAAQAAVRSCGTSSDIYCRGLVEGAYCQIGTTAGKCVGSPACRCQPVSGRGGRPGGR